MEQRLIQSPQMIQAMQILQLPAMELEDRIEQELTENPLLERLDAAAEGDPAPTADVAAQEEQAKVEAMLNELERYSPDREQMPRTRSTYDEDGDRKLEAMQNTPDEPKNLAESLIEELAFTELDERGRDIAEFVLYSLDDRGYLTMTVEELARDCDVPNTTVDEVLAALNELRRLIHPALGARDLRECWLLQLDAHGLEDPLVRQIVEQHLEDVTANRLPRIAKATGRPIEDVKGALDELRALDPRPGAQFGGAPATAILPDVVVELVDGKYEIKVSRDWTPRLTLNPIYRQYLKEARKGDGVQEWVKKRIESARWFIDAVAQRQSTLKRIAESIFRRQRGFLEEGVRLLHPLRMQEVADEVGVHISTVSRAVSGKYAQTPRGSYPLKYFFTGGTQKEDGEVESQTAIKQRIAELVAKEDRTNPLSDDQLAALLEHTDKIKIARRTVTKYRKALSIPSSSQRKLF
jgi:RNA polymerase sigma-54 factor